MASSFELILNGEPRTVRDLAPTTTLLDYLRGLGLTGTKEGCGEGDCGACTVVVADVDGLGRRTYRAVHSCITLLPMFAGREVLTVEGIGSRQAPHPVQVAMVRGYGSQCGFCTPGVIASMFEGYYRDDIPADASSEPDAARVRTALVDQLSGNICRCTGYRPIRDAMLLARRERCAREARGEGPDAFQRRLEGASVALPPVDYSACGQRFVRTTRLADLLELRAAHPEAVVVSGASEIGVERNKKGRSFPLLLSTEGVPELATVAPRGDAFWIGAAATLTQISEATAGAIPCLDEMLGVFAARQVRNRATLGGSMATASPIGDLAPVMLALGASVVVASVHGERTIGVDDFFAGYRRTSLAPDEILVAVLVPTTPPAGLVRRARALKVSKRRELDISIVSAAFAVDLDDRGVIHQARLAYGGVAATPVRAREAEGFLAGRSWTDDTLAGALEILGRSFTPIDDVRSGRGFRSGLVVSLFEKFWRGDRSEAHDASRDFVPAEPTVDTTPAASLRHESAWGHVTGGALYVDDEASRRPGMLYLWPVTSAHAHARIVRVDASEAERMPGVVAVLTAADVPGLNDVGAVKRDEPLLAGGEILYFGQMLAAVVGESREACRLAAQKVTVEAEPLPAILGPRAAVAADSYLNEPHVISRGDVDAAMAASPHVLEGELDTGGQEHLYLETQAAWAERRDDDDVFVCSSSQHPTEIQTVVARVLRLPMSKVVVQVPRMGGGFGGKESQGNAFAALAALAAWKTGRPACVQLDRDVDMQVTGKRHPFFVRFSAGFDDEGRVLAVRATLASDGGYAFDVSHSILDRALFHLDNAYYLPAVRFEGRVARTNSASNTAFRGFGGPQGALVVEEVMDRVARSLGLPPEVVRERNLYRNDPASPATSTTHYGQELGEVRIGRIWGELCASSRFDDRRREIAEWNREHPPCKRGLAVTPVKFGISFTAGFMNQAGALVLVYRDGTVQVNHGGTEMGQGLATKVQGVAMRAFGLPPERVRVMKTQTDKVPNTSATAASSGADLNGAAVLAACDTLRERLAPVAAMMINDKLGTAVHAGTIRFDGGLVRSVEAALTLRFEEVVDRAYFAQIPLFATGYYRTPGIVYDKPNGRGRPFHYFAYGAAVSEVEIDASAGALRIRRVDILHDVGESLNPAIDRGQIEGGFVQGAGWLTAEELKWDAAGRLMTRSASTYMVPAIGDAPADIRVALLQNAPQPGVVHGSKAVGEPPLLLAMSVREAIRDAVAAFGDGAPGVIELPLPATHEAIFHAIRAVQRRAGGSPPSR